MITIWGRTHGGKQWCCLYTEVATVELARKIVDIWCHRFDELNWRLDMGYIDSTIIDGSYPLAKWALMDYRRRVLGKTGVRIECPRITC